MRAGFGDHTLTESGHPAAEVNCRMGYTEHHVAFALLHLALLGYFLHSCASGYLRGLISGCAAFNIAYQMLLGGLCWSPTLSAAAHAHFTTFAVVRLALFQWVANGLVTAVVATHFVNAKSEGTVRVRNLSILGGLGLANSFAQYWWWTHELTENTLAASVLPASLLNFLSLLIIYSVTKTKAMAMYLCIAPAIPLAIAAVNMYYPIDLEGRLLNNPESDFHDQNLHWSMCLRQFFISMGVLTTRAAASHAVNAEIRSRASDKAPLTADLSATHSSLATHLQLSAIVVLAAVLSQTWHSNPAMLVGTQHMRDLLGMDDQLDSDSLQWLLPCIRWGECAVLLTMMVLPSRSAVRRWQLTRTHKAAGQWQANKCRRDHSGGCNLAHSLARFGQEHDSPLLGKHKTDWAMAGLCDPGEDCSFPLQRLNVPQQVTSTVVHTHLPLQLPPSSICTDVDKLREEVEALYGHLGTSALASSTGGQRQEQNAHQVLVCPSGYAADYKLTVRTNFTGTLLHVGMPKLPSSDPSFKAQAMSEDACRGRQRQSRAPYESSQQIILPVLDSTTYQHYLGMPPQQQRMDVALEASVAVQAAQHQIGTMELEGAVQIWDSPLVDVALQKGNMGSTIQGTSSIQAGWEDPSPGLTSSSTLDRQLEGAAQTFRSCLVQVDDNDTGHASSCPGNYLPHSSMRAESMQTSLSVDGVNFELVVHSNYDRPRHPQPCDCDLCSKQGTVLVANDRSLTVEGRCNPGPPQGGEAQVTLQYVAVHKSTDDCIIDETCRDVWVLEQLGVIAGAVFCVEVPAKQLVSSYHGIAATKKAVCKSQAAVGTFRTHLRAEVTCIGAHKARSFRVYSPEVYVAGNRNFRRISHQV